MLTRVLTIAAVASLLLAPSAPAQNKATPETPRDPRGGEKVPELPEVVKDMLSGKPPVKGAGVTPVAHVETLGKGPVHLVLVPGLACDWTVWKGFMERNADRYTMHAVTLPGFAGSEPPALPPDTAPAQPVWLDNATKAIGLAIDELHAGAPVLVMGHSMGGFLAMRSALAFPEKVAAAVSVDGFAAVPIAGPATIPVESRQGIVNTQMGTWFETQLAADDKAGLRRMFKSAVSDAKRGEELAAYAASQPAETVKRYFYEYLGSDITTDLISVKVPVLILAAQTKVDPEHPEVTPVPSRDTWTNQLVNATSKITLKFIEDSHHFIQEDQPKELDEKVAEFVGTVTKK